MTTDMQMVLGTEPFLKQLIKKYQQADTRLLQGLTRGQSFGLLDTKGKIPFVSPMAYQIVTDFGTVPKTGFMHFEYFSLTSEQEKVFVSQAKHVVENAACLEGLVSMHLLKRHSKTIEYTIASSWERKLDVFASRSTPLIAPINTFAQRAADGMGYHEAAYQIIDPNAKDETTEEQQKAPLTLYDLLHTQETVNQD